MSTAIPRDGRYFRERTAITDTGCWEWQLRKYRGPRGGFYGFSSRRGEQTPIAAHRLAYEVFKGQIPDGYEIDHTCENTLCCNPGHLEAVTPGENKRRTWQRGSGANQNTAKEACGKCGGPFDVVRPGRSGRTQRMCGPCDKTYQQAYYQKNRGRIRARQNESRRKATRQ